MSSKKTCFFILLQLHLVVVLYAQPITNYNPYTITQLSLKQGLPQSQVSNIIQTDNGNLLVITANGIVEYNGIEFKPFIKTNDYKNFVYQKTLWHSASRTLFGIAFYDKGFYQIYPNNRYLGEFKDVSLLGDSIYGIDYNGVISVTPIKTLHFKKVYFSQIKQAIAIHAERNTIFISTQKNTYCFNKKTKTSKLVYEGLINSIKKNPYNQLLYFLKEKNIDIYTIDGEKINDCNIVKARCICFLNRNQYIVCNDDGICFVKNNEIEKINCLSHQEISLAIADTKQQTLFIGSYTKGFYKLIYKNCKSLIPQTGITSELYSIIPFDHKILTVEGCGKIYEVTKDSLKIYLNEKAHWGMLSNINDTLCAAEYPIGIRLIHHQKTVGYINSPNQLPNFFVKAVFRDSKGTIWVGTQNGISKGTSLQNLKPYLTNQVNGVAYCFYESKSKEHLYIGSTNGVYVLDKNNLVQDVLGKHKGVKGREVRGFYEDSLNRIWFGTYGGGLYCYDKGKVTGINQLKNCALDGDIFCLAKDHLGYLYSTSNHGLWRLKEKDLFEFYEGKKTYLIPFFYGEEEGLQNIEFNGGFEHNFFKQDNGTMYFPSLEGVVRVIPETLSFQKRNISIDKITINDSLIVENQTLFNRNTDVITFDFSSTNFLQKSNVYYQYSLQNHQHNEKENWSPISKKRSVTLKSLPPGKYTFKVRALDGFNDSKPNEAVYSFEITPYFYETLWFNLLLVSLFLIAVFIFYRYRTNQHHKKVQQEEKIKTTIAELELKAVQAQMNPHFVFNSLNSIKYYLSINDQKNADLFIDDFALLLRNFLDYSNLNFISIDKEIQLLTSYLNLEKMRMNDAFDFEIKALLDSSLIIPTILIQPFVENAVKHGITHSNKKCKLTINFSLKSNKIYCVIEDDGVGREFSKKINARIQSHESKGLNLVKDKINMLKQQYQLDIMLEMIDKPESTGTIICLVIPVFTKESLT